MDHRGKRVFKKRSKRSDDAGKNGSEAHHAPLLGVLCDVMLASAAGSLDDATSQTTGACTQHSPDAALRGKSVHHGDRQLTRVRIWTLKADHLLNPAKKRSQQPHAKDEIRGRSSIGERLVYSLQLIFAGGALLFPKMEVFGMPNDVLYDAGEMKEGGFGNVLIIGECDQVGREWDVGRPESKNLARRQN